MNYQFGIISHFHRVVRTMLVLGVILFMQIYHGCAEAQMKSEQAFDVSRWAVPIEKPGLPNLHKVSEDLYRGAQPTTQGFQELHKMGMKTVVNLRSRHSDQDKLGNIDLTYIEIPMNAWHPEDEDVVKFLQVTTDPEKVPVFVHCQHGADRTGVIVASYRVIVQGWSKDEAIAEMMEGDFGFHAVWINLPRFIRNLNVEKVRKDLGLDEE
ncbi:protein tyrosine/serine phosphatase [Candidatus Vecturithrix granuli]|uniref:Protein tyrosine/serine phosphatase n=1 Tax=Vecturithrix granuli TaxID=1499967 RepID=A0A081C033_VECG1|nr:protein tyrosine/serine phosphatase [Candidatus Vecturithrix granuli]